MKKKRMGIFLIIVGIVLVCVGISCICSSINDDEQKTKDTANTIELSSQNRTSYTTPRVDTVYIPQQVVEKIVEKTVVVEKGEKSEPEKMPEDNRTKEEVIGQKFEDFFVNLLADRRFRLLDRTMDKKTSEGVYAESCMNPDLHVSQIYEPQWLDYYIECKYRSTWYNDKVTFKEYQVNRYKAFQRKSHRKVLFALGVGGKPESPSTLMIVPLDSLEDNSIMQCWIKKYQIHATSDALFYNMSSYFSHVFDVSKKRKYKMAE